jgi:hypothetical protein
MAVTVKPIKLWRKEIENKPGALAQTLEPLAAKGADLQVVMGYRYPGHEETAAVEVYPIANKKLSTAAAAAGLRDCRGAWRRRQQAWPGACDHASYCRRRNQPGFRSGAGDGPEILGGSWFRQ